MRVVWKTRLEKGRVATRAEYPGLDPRPVHFEIIDSVPFVWVDCSHPDSDLGKTNTTWLEFRVFATGEEFHPVWSIFGSQVCRYSIGYEVWHLGWANESDR